MYEGEVKIKHFPQQRPAEHCPDIGFAGFPFENYPVGQTS